VKSAVWEPRFLEHLRAAGRTERTIGGYIAELRLFLAFLADRGVEEPHQLTRQDVEAYQVSLLHRRKPNGDPLKLASRHAKISAVLVFLRFLYNSQVLLLDLTRGIRQPGLPRRLLPKLPSVAQIVKLLDAPDTTTPLGLRDRAIMEVFYSSALRNTELRSLRLEDIDLDRLELRILVAKGRKPRVLPLGEPAAAWLQEYLDKARAYFVRDHEHRLLFASLRGGRLRVETMIQLVTKHAKAAALPMKVTPHILRHCCATHMLAHGAELRYLQELLGHGSPEATQIYTQVDLLELRSVHQRCHPRESFG
jgi:integrase/recombinase XerD